MTDCIAPIMVEVTSADREVYLLCILPHPRDDLDLWCVRKIRDGVDDLQPVMQAIARHRLTGNGAMA